MLFVSRVPFHELGESFRDEEIQEEDNREEVAESDIEIARDGEEDIECDK